MKIGNVAIAFGFATVCVVCATVLAVTNHVTPVELWTLAGVGVGGGAGVALPASPLGAFVSAASSAQETGATVAGGTQPIPAETSAPAATSITAPLTDPRTQSGVEP